MYTKGAKSPWTNVSADRLVFGRNVALLELAGSEPLKRSELLKMTHLEEPDLKDILDQVCCMFFVLVLLSCRCCLNASSNPCVACSVDSWGGVEAQV